MQGKTLHQPFKRLLFALCLGIILFFLFSRGLPSSLGVLGNVFSNALHFPVFFLITLGIARVLPLGMSPGQRLLTAVLSAIGLGISSELIHSVTIGRSASLGDFLLDLLGVGFAAIILKWGSQWKRGGWAVFCFSAVICFNLVLLPFWLQLRAEIIYQSRIPDLGCFSESFCLRIWQRQGNAQVEQTDNSLSVTIGPGKFGGVSCLAKQNWAREAADLLCLEFTNKGENFFLGIRIDDDNGARFYDEAEIITGKTEIQISLREIDNKVDLAHISRIALFTEDEHETRRYIINSAFLE